MDISEVINDLPWKDLRASFKGAVGRGQKRGAAAKQIAEVVDLVIDWDEIVPGKTGETLERWDGHVIRAAIVIGLLFSRRGE